MLLLVLYLITLISTATSQQTNQRRVANIPHIIKQCFYEGRWFPAGSIISAGRSGSWCYGTYCDLDGIVRYWDDHNCQAQSKNNMQIPFPNLMATTTTTTTAPPTTAPPTFWFPTTTESSFSNMGCFYQGRFYWPGVDIFNKRRGSRCLGAYCDWNSQVQTWEDDCRYTMPPPQPQQHHQMPANTPVDPT